MSVTLVIVCSAIIWIGVGLQHYFESFLHFENNSDYFRYENISEEKSEKIHQGYAEELRKYE